MNSPARQSTGSRKERGSDVRAAKSPGSYRLAVGLGVCIVAALILILLAWYRSNLGGFVRIGASPKNEFASAPPPTLSSASTVEEVKAELLRLAQRLAESFPDDAAALDVRARIEFSLGRRNAAMDLWRRCADLNPQDPSAYYKAMGIIAANSGSQEEAVELFRKAMQGSRDPEVPLLLAENLTQVGNLQEAAQVLEACLERAPVSAAALTALGQIYLELELCEKAKAVFHSAIKSEPDNKTACYGLARAYTRLEQPENAKIYLDQFATLEAQQSVREKKDLEAFSDDTLSRTTALRTLIDAARCFRRNGQPVQAADLLRNAAALSPRDVESRAELLTLYAENGSDRLALEIGHQLQRMDPTNGDHWMNVGVLSARLGNLHDGLAAMREALRLDPQNRRYQEAYDLMRREK